jgi:hypothetical protein
MIQAQPKLFVSPWPGAHFLRRPYVLAFLHFPQEHWRKIWSINRLERLNKKIKRRTNLVGLFPNDRAIVRLVGSLRLDLLTVACGQCLALRAIVEL